MIKKVLIVFFFFVLIVSSFGAGYFVYANFNPKFADLSPEEMYKTITQDRAYAIELAEKRGEYKCCIEPPCTMCYDGPTKWNYGQAGKCFCDDFIARGEEPCPQCKKGVCSSENHLSSKDSPYCLINQDNSSKINNN